MDLPINAQEGRSAMNLSFRIPLGLFEVEGCVTISRTATLDIITRLRRISTQIRYDALKHLCGNRNVQQGLDTMPVELLEKICASLRMPDIYIVTLSR